MTTEAHDPGQAVEAPAPAGGVGLATIHLPSEQEAPRVDADEPAAATSRLRRRDLVVLLVITLLVALATFDVILWLDRRT